jgi:hypothetical protein
MALSLVSGAGLLAHRRSGFDLKTAIEADARRKCGSRHNHWPKFTCDQETASRSPRTMGKALLVGDSRNCLSGVRAHSSPRHDEPRSRPETRSLLSDTKALLYTLGHVT